MVISRALPASAATKSNEQIPRDSFLIEKQSMGKMAIPFAFYFHMIARVESFQKT
jgi:hypothetical protein